MYLTTNPDLFPKSNQLKNVLGNGKENQKTDVMNVTGKRNYKENCKPKANAVKESFTSFTMLEKR
jgi:hypothetical protein